MRGESRLAAIDEDTHPPTRASAAVFSGKAALLRLRRWAQDLASGVRRHPRGERDAFPIILSESRSPLWSDAHGSERSLELGKVQNLRRACRALDGTVILPGAAFSFWKQVGRATRGRGYVEGRQLLEGCLIPAVGGGLCQLSNALYEVALQAGLEIVERHAHSRVIPGSAAAAGRDATVAWNYIDLRFRSKEPLLIEARLTRDTLVVQLRSQPGAPSPEQLARIGQTPNSLPVWAERRLSRPLPLLEPTTHSCGTCGVQSCFRCGSGPEWSAERAAFLVDECWPEFRRYVSASRSPDHVLGLPLDGIRWRRPRYGWETTGYSRVISATAETLCRSLASRRLGRYGAARLQAELEAAAGLAARLARALTPDVTRVYIAQSLLPFLWREGHLGGRRFAVLMTRLPLRALHDRLDRALAEHPDRGTLGEFRAPGWIAAAEWEALEAADRIVTPHAEIASLFPGKALRLDWDLPRTATPGRTPRRSPPVIVFPGPTAARKGAHELREAIRDLPVEVLLLGSELEGAAFWDGMRTRHAERDSRHWRDEAALVVQPALVEEKPRALLAALAAGIPVVASPACGLGTLPGVVTVPCRDVAALRQAIDALLGVRTGEGDHARSPRTGP